MLFFGTLHSDAYIFPFLLCFLLLFFSQLFVRPPQTEIEETKRMGKTGDIFKKIRDTKGTFHAKRCTIKDRNCMGLREAEDNKNRW